MIEKHFLTGFPWSLNAPKIVSFDFVLIQKLGDCKRAIDNTFPGTETLGKAYNNLNTNMFGVGYLERMQKIVGDEKNIFKGKLDVSKKRQENIEKLF
jgi:hypothetical protein